MPGGFPLGLEICNGTSVGFVAASTTGTQVLANATANTLGSWVQIIASTAADCCMLGIHISGFSSNGPNGAVDIGIGAAASEVIILQQLMVSYFDANGAADALFLIPVNIPAGTRIAARCQVDHASDGVWVDLTLFDGAFTQVDGFAGVDSIGFVAGTTVGTQLDPGAVANTKGAYAQLTASTSRDYAGLFFVFDGLGQITGTIHNTDNFAIDVAIGGAGSEQIIIPNIGTQKVYEGTLNEVGFIPMLTHIKWIPIPSGTRIAARCQCSTNTATERLMGITAYGIYQ